MLVVPAGRIVGVPDEEACLHGYLFLVVEVPVPGLARVQVVVLLVDLFFEVGGSQQVALFELMLVVATAIALVRVQNSVLENQLVSLGEEVALGPHAKAHLRVVVGEGVPRVPLHRRLLPTDLVLALLFRLLLRLLLLLLPTFHTAHLLLGHVVGVFSSRIRL